MAPQPRVFFDFAVGGEPLGRVVFELFSNAVPKTAENFRALCTGEKGVSPISHLASHYKNTPVHRIIDGFMIQGGDFTKKNGSGGESIYGGQFPDERLSGDGTDVDREGLLVMANRGPDTNGSQWFITLAPAPHLTGKHVVFGRVIHGLEHVLAIGKLPTDDRDRPLSPVTIPHCGELELRKPPPKKRSPSPSPRRSASPRRADRGSDSESDDSRRRKEKSRRREKKESRSKNKKPRGAREAREETLDELDARLEREEKERLEAERLERVEEQKREIERERIRAKESGDVVYKGRGAMRYLDPESLRAKRIPQNYDARQPDARPRRGRGDRVERGHRGDLPEGGYRGEGDRAERGQRGERDRAGGSDVDGKWTRGAVSKDSLDRDLERYRPKAKKTTVDYDDWRVGRDRAYGERFTAGADPANGTASGAANGGNSGHASGVRRDDGSRSRSRSRSVRRPDSRSRSRSRSPIRRRSPSPSGERERGSASASDMEMDPED